MTDSGRPKCVLFVCHENCNRSQMAEAFARMHGAGLVEPYSAGCHPAHSVSAQAIAAMRDLGYDLGQHFPKGLSQVPDVEYDVVVMMSQDRCPGLKAKHREEWNIPVPKWMPPEQFRAVRDQIAEKVRELLAGLRNTD